MRYVCPLEREKAWSDPRAISQKGVKGSLLPFTGKCGSLESEPRERIVLQGTNSLFVCVPLGEENGRKGAKFKERTVSLFLQSACSLKNCCVSQT